MSFGVGLRNAVAIGPSDIILLFSGDFNENIMASNFKTKSGVNLTQKDGDFSLLE
jgi:hypothetical protein